VSQQATLTAEKTLSGEAVDLSRLKIYDPEYQVKTLDDIWRGQCNQAWAQLKYLSQYNLSHTDVATLIRSLSSDLTGNVIAFPQSRSHRKVYIYKPYIGLWELQTDEGIYFNHSIDVIRRRLSKEVIQPLERFAECMARQEDAYSETLSECSVSSNAASPSKLVKHKLKLYKEFYHRLGDDTFKQKVINQMVKQYIHETRMLEYTPDMFDKRTRCLGFNDGVYDFEQGEILTGAKAKEYYITQTVGYNYSDVETVDDATYNAFMCFVSQIIPDESLRRYLFKRFNKALQKIVEKLVLILYNKRGDNGKTALLTLVGKAFGDTYVKCNNNLLKKPSLVTASGPNEELASIANMRLVVFGEPSGTLNMSLVKELCGGDEISTSRKHEKKMTFVSTALLVLLCNAIPSPDCKEKATFKKLRCVPFEAEFVDSAREVDESKFKFLKNESINEQFDNWRAACMKYVLSLTREDVQEPSKVLEHTNRYQQQEDTLMNFVTDVLMSSESGIVRRVDLWEEWKRWSRDEGASLRKSEFNEKIMDTMSQKGYTWYADTYHSGIRMKCCWRGCAFKEDSVEQEEVLPLL